MGLGSLSGKWLKLGQNLLKSACSLRFSGRFRPSPPKISAVFLRKSAVFRALPVAVPRKLPLETGRNHLPPPSFSHHLLRGKESEAGYFSFWTDIMNVIPNAYRIYPAPSLRVFLPCGRNPRETQAHQPEDQGPPASPAHSGRAVDGANPPSNGG